MWEKIKTVFTIPELKQKILLTLFLLAIYSVGRQIPLPVVDPVKMKEAFGGEGGLGGLLSSLAVFSASSLSQLTIFGLGIMPYISASIIFQLLGSVVPTLEKLQKEGESGRKKINEYTRYATVVICLFQSWFYLRWMESSAAGEGILRSEFVTSEGRMFFFAELVTVLTMTTGTLFLMWIGEQIDEFGIGNGISLLIMAGILVDMPGAANQLFSPIMKYGLSLGGASGALGVERLLVLVILFIAIIAGVVFITLGQRRIPTQSAKHVRGRRVFGGNKQYLPLRVNQSGVMPIIFASSLLLFPAWIFSQLSQSYPQFELWQQLNSVFQRGDSYWYNVLYVALIFFFCYFWTAVTFNPNEMANNLKDFGTFIPGYRPGKRTAEHLEKVMIRITYVGAAFLAVVAVTPTVISAWLDIPGVVSQFFGGTGLLIAVSVAFDLVQKIDSHLVMRNYKGLLERT